MKTEQIHHLDVEGVITPPGRIRRSIGNVDSLMESIKSKGQLHPIIINKEKVLISGERRLEACRQLGISVLVRYREDLSEADMTEIEVMENAARLDFTWQEGVQAVNRLHELKVKQFGKAVDGKRGITGKPKGWGFSRTGLLLGKSGESIRLDCKLATLIPQYPELAKFGKKSDAYKKVRDIYEDAALMELARRAMSEQKTAKKAVELDPSNIDATSPIARIAATEGSDLTADEIMGMGGFDDGEKALLIDLLSSESKQAVPLGATRELVEQIKSEMGDGREIMSKWFMLGDCFDILPTLEKERFNLVIADPPYGIEIGTTTANNEIGVFEDSPDWVFKTIPRLLKECWRVMAVDSHMYMFFALGDPSHKKGSFYDFLVKQARKIGFEVDALPLIWMKGKHTGKSGDPLKYPGRSYEMILYMRKGNLSLAARGLGNVLVEDPVPGINKLHPTEKPRFIVNNILLRSAHHTRIEVLDPMAGSGATIDGCLKKLIPCVGIEIDPSYHARGLDRLAETFTTLPIPLVKRLVEGQNG